MNLSFKTFLSVFCLSSAVSPSNAMVMKSPQEEATEGRYDYQAVLVKSDGSFGYCTGTLIAPEYVLTVGYCATEGHTKVQLGRHDLSDDNEDYEEINIASVIIDDKNSDYDYYYIDTVAIMKLEEESSIEPVTLYTGSTDLSVDTEVTVLGWGLASVGDDDIFGFVDDEEVDGLLETETKVALSESCDDYFYTENRFDRVMCTTRNDAEDFFDIGSAVIVKGSSSSSDVQVGVDYGIGCSPIVCIFPGIIFRVSYFKDFIDCVLNGGTEDCGKTIDITEAPISAPTKAPSSAPTKAPSSAPNKAPTEAPSSAPTKAPSSAPNKAPTEATEDDCCTDSDSSKTILELVRGSFGFE